MFFCRWRVKVHTRPWGRSICCLTILRLIWPLKGTETHWPLFEDLLTPIKISPSSSQGNRKDSIGLLHSFSFNPLCSLVRVLFFAGFNVFVILRPPFLSWGQVSVLRPHWVLHMKQQSKTVLLGKLWYLFVLCIICIFVFMTNVLMPMNKRLFDKIPPLAFIRNG